VKRFGIGVAFAALAVASVYACDDDPKSHVYVAALFEPTKTCFGPSTSLGQIATPDGDLDCAPTCLVLGAPTTGGAVETYVSTMCGPYPAAYDTSQTDPSCAPALAAWPAEQDALGDGTNSCAGAPTADAGGGDAEADDGGGSTANDASDAGAIDAAAIDGAEDGAADDASGAG
jgi:hypothetical protein